MADKTSNSNLQPWWNRPLWGDKSMLEKLESIIHKPHDSIPEEVIEHHQRVFGELKILTPIAKALDSNEFNNPEFLEFVHISKLFAYEIGEYKGLKNYIALFRVAVEARNSFLKIEQIELSYRSSKQQEMYRFLLGLLEQQLNREEFIKKLEQKQQEILPEIHSEEGKDAINVYTETLKKLARQDELGIKLMYLFKKYQLENFSLLRIISEIVQYLLERNLLDFNDIKILVRANQDLFDQLGKVIELPIDKTREEDYARMLQYIAMKQKYQDIYIQFLRLLEVMTSWSHFYLILKEIREHYDPDEFEIPEEFNTPIPGIEIYNKYQSVITKKYKST
ncbi:hypothetical protein H6G11_05525 [Cyanobacterium aponinum FACHB-4101]|uniref:hypothetical protein n=1 Tax=Cyanobacterium aponinum TaxID=379064 RepID=UPI001680D910|nr:hypothetical protein [Cyanobacterium aponinum]MBD2393714.1 hypothetical protein [Cyanobacterium aponinum FACHB-4101]